MKKKNIIKFLGLQFSRRDPIFQKLMGPRTPFWKCLAPTLVMGKIKVWGHKVGPTSYFLLTHIPFIPWQSALPFLRYGYFKIWPWKQGHTWRSHGGPNILSTQIPFIPCQPSLQLPFLRYGYFKIWPWKSKVNYMGKVKCHHILSQGHSSRSFSRSNDQYPNDRRLDCLHNRLFRRRSKKTSKLHVTGLCEGNSLVTSEFPA